MDTNHQPRKIAIVGAGFTGVALVAALKRYADQPLSIYLYEKTNNFGAGDAYRTPYPYHLLNARVHDMSALEDDSDHFLDWLNQHPETKQYLELDEPLAKQFVPRILYHQYLQAILADVQSVGASLVSLQTVPAEVTKIVPTGDGVTVTLADGATSMVDDVVLALGNNPPGDFPFAVPAEVSEINNPWDYTALKDIPADEPVMIVGTGLSMVDAVMTLYQQHHKGKIYAVSRRGLIPLPHTDSKAPCHLDCASLPTDMLPLTKVVREACATLDHQGGDWRNVINHMRHSLEELWLRLDLKAKKQFLRHVLPYWNIHRHRVHEKLYNLLVQLQQQAQLQVLAGRVQGFNGETVCVRQRKTHAELNFPVKHIINCMGSSFDYALNKQPLLADLYQHDLISLDELRLGLAVNDDYQLITKSGQPLESFYTLGPPMRGELWECIAVPEIRKQCKRLAGKILAKQKAGVA